MEPVFCTGCGKPFRPSPERKTCPRCGELGADPKASVTRKRKPISEKLRALAEQKDADRRADEAAAAVLDPPPPVVIPDPDPPLANTLGASSPALKEPDRSEDAVNAEELGRFAATPSGPSAATRRPLTARRQYSPVPYEPHLIYEFAARLYREAALVLFVFIVGGLLGGGLMGVFGGALIASASRAELGRDRALTVLAASGILGAIVGALLGYFAGVEAAFWIKLKAQLTLCQLKIEENTRAA